MKKPHWKDISWYDFACKGKTCFIMLNSLAFFINNFGCWFIKPKNSWFHWFIIINHSMKINWNWLSRCFIIINHSMNMHAYQLILFHIPLISLLVTTSRSLPPITVTHWGNSEIHSINSSKSSAKAHWSTLYQWS